MKKNVILSLKFIILFSLFTSCSPHDSKDGSVNHEKQYSLDELNKNSVDDKVHFIVSKLVNYDLAFCRYTNKPIDISSLKAKEKMAIQLLNTVINSDEFKSQVLATNFTQKNGLSNEQVYDTLMSNNDITRAIREHLTLEIDTSYEWNVRYQRGNHPTIGYDNTEGDSTVNTVQIQLLYNLTPQDYAAHIAHEYCHMRRFYHLGPRKNETVPYGIQHIVENLLNISKTSKVYYLDEDTRK